MPQLQDDRFQDNLSVEDRLTYRRWVRGLFVFYSFALAVVLVVGLMSSPTDDLKASNEIQIARLKAKPDSIAVSRPDSPVGRH